MSGSSPRPPGRGTTRPRRSPRRAWRRLAAGVVVTASLVLAIATGASRDSRSAGSRLAYPDTFPAGDGKAIADRACLFCHSAMLVTQQAKDSTGWEKTLTTMKGWGAPLESAERDTLRAYLLARFGPRPPSAK